MLGFLLAPAATRQLCQRQPAEQQKDEDRRVMNHQNFSGRSSA